MITNDVQYRTTKTLLGQFEDAASNLETGLAGARNKKLRQLQIDAVQAQAQDRAVEIAEYEGNSDPVRRRRSRPTRSATCRPWLSGLVLLGAGRSAASLPSLASRSNRSSVTRRTGMRPPAWPGCARSPTRSVCASARPVNSRPTRQRPYVGADGNRLGGSWRHAREGRGDALQADGFSKLPSMCKDPATMLRRSCRR